MDEDTPQRHGYLLGDQLVVLTGGSENPTYYARSGYVWQNRDGRPHTQVYGADRNALSARNAHGIASAMNVMVHPTEEDAVAAFEAVHPGPFWQDVCVEVFGDEWIAPLSEVLGINRRTVERWRSGSTPIPEAMQETIVGIGKDALDRRAYGSVLRRIAGGESAWTIRTSAQSVVTAVEHFEWDLAKGDPVAMRAARNE